MISAKGIAVMIRFVFIINTLLKLKLNTNAIEEMHPWMDVLISRIFFAVEDVWMH